MGPVPVVVVRCGVVLDEVPAVDVIDVAVVVVVDAVSGDLAGICPDVVGKVGVVSVDAAVDNGDDDRSAGTGAIPGCGCVDAVGAEESPERSGIRVVGRGDMNGGVECHLTDGGMRFERFPGLVEIGSCFEQVDIALAEPSDERCVGEAEQIVDVGGIGIGLELDEECVGVVVDVGAVFEHDVGKLIGVAPRAVERECFVGRRLGRCHAHGRGCDNEGEREDGR